MHSNGLGPFTQKSGNSYAISGLCIDTIKGNG